MNLENRNALITGGSQGLGKAIAEQFVREGANIVICARDEKLLSRARADWYQAFAAPGDGRTPT